MSQEPTRDRQLLGVEEIRALMDRAVALLHHSKTDWWESGYKLEERRQWNETALEALRFCAAAASQLQDPSLLGPLAAALVTVEGRFDFSGGNIETMAHGI